MENQLVEMPYFKSVQAYKKLEHGAVGIIPYPEGKPEIWGQKKGQNKLRSQENGEIPRLSRCRCSDSEDGTPCWKGHHGCPSPGDYEGCKERFDGRIDGNTNYGSQVQNFHGKNPICRGPYLDVDRVSHINAHACSQGWSTQQPQNPNKVATKDWNDIVIGSEKSRALYQEPARGIHDVPSGTANSSASPQEQTTVEEDWSGTKCRGTKSQTRQKKFKFPIQ